MLNCSKNIARLPFTADSLILKLSCLSLKGQCIKYNYIFKERFIVIDYYVVITAITVNLFHKCWGVHVAQAHGGARGRVVG